MPENDSTCRSPSTASSATCTARARRHRRHDRLVLLPALRLAERLRLDPRRREGGRYRIAPASDDWTPKQLYFPDTNVLITRFLTPDGVGEVQDFMPVQPAGASEHRQRLIRRVLGVRGEMRFRVEVEPRFDYGARPAPGRVPRDRRGLPLGRPLPRSRDGDAAAPARRTARRARRVHARAGESATFVLEQVPERLRAARKYSEDETREAFEATVEYWRRWLVAVALHGPLARDGAPLGADPQAADLRADRRDRRRARRRACPSRSAASATGTTATCGSATRPSRSTRCCGSASPTRRRRS